MDKYAPNVRVKLAYGAACLCCKHFWGAGKCAAFPYGIPFAILENRHDHRTEHYKDDHGLLWESGIKAVRDGGQARDLDAQGQAPEGQQDTEGA